MPTISVIVPVYNVEKYINRCVDSILAQTFTDFEVILVDDGSTDRSGEICDRYSHQYAQIRVIHKENGGLATAKNAGLDIANGQYISFVDSDDTIEQDMLEELYKPLQGKQNKISMCGRYNVNEKTMALTKLFVLDQTVVWERVEAIRRFLTWDHIDGSSCDKLFPKALIGSLRFPAGYVSEDIPFAYEILKKCDSVIHIGVPKYYYLQRTGSLSKSKKISSTSLGLVLYNKAIRNDVMERYPELRAEADYFYYSRCLIFQARMSYRYMSSRMFKENLKEIRAGYSMIIGNHFFSENEKKRAKEYNNRFYTLLCFLRLIKHELLRM